MAKTIISCLALGAIGAFLSIWIFFEDFTTGQRWAKHLMVYLFTIIYYIVMSVLWLPQAL